MKFETRPTADSEGWQLAHSVLCDGKKLKKTHLISTRDIHELIQQDITSLQVFKFEEGDISEDDAAMQAAHAICGENLSVSQAGNGRANLVAVTNGVFCTGGAIDQLNQIDDAFSVASLSENTAVFKGQLVATIKLIPYGLKASILDKIPDRQTAYVRAYQPYSGALITTDPHFNAKVEDITRQRMARTGGKLDTIEQCSHNEVQLAKQLITMCERGHDIILLLGASAISDTKDVIPAAIAHAGGTITKLGLPTDPGNLTMLADLNGIPIVGLPGCAKSPALNGLDWVLERFAAGLPIDHPSLSKMGVGGLLKEPKGRTVKRVTEPKTSQSQGPTSGRGIAVAILAAGKSKRSGSSHKLLTTLNGVAVISKTVDVVSSCFDQPPTVVTGHKADEVTQTLNGQLCSTSYNEHYADGMGTSLSHAVQKIPADSDWLLVCLGDMPFISKKTFELMKSAAYATSATVIIPTFHGKQGHPVLWHKRHFVALTALSGDVGGKMILQSEDATIQEIPTDDPGILIDLDTPEMLNQFGATPD